MDSYTLSLNMHERPIITHIHILTILPYINTSMTRVVVCIYMTFNVDNSQYNKYFDIPVFHRVYGY
jgi:hypothetical protein